jgi:lysophospholipase L1-like esterase
LYHLLLTVWHTDRRTIAFTRGTGTGFSITGIIMPLITRIALITLIIVAAESPAGAEEFALRDGDTVVFLGDSITAARAYGKLIENYTLLRFPERKIRFINAGRGGDTAAGGLARLDADVFAHRATVLTVAYGVNDIGWGLKADDEHKQTYLHAIRGIVERCKAQNVRVFICSAAVTGADPGKSERDFLQTMCDEGMALSRELGAGAIDVQRTMRAIQRRIWKFNEGIADSAKKESLHAADGVHLNDLGQLAMGYAILKGLGAPAEVSSATIDAAVPKATASAACQITNVKNSAGTVEFDRLDERLPLNQGPLWGLQFRFVPIPDELNRYLVTVQNLAPGKYELLADGRGLGTFGDDQLSKGLNISSATADGWIPGGPWDAQATVLKRLTDARDELAVSQLFERAFDAQNPAGQTQGASAKAINEQLEELQRATARPRRYHFVIRPATAK